MAFPLPRSDYPCTGYLEPMVSYAQNFEDVTLRRAFPDIGIGFWIDIGAYHPTRCSVTKWFYDKGWRGVNIEPVPGLFRYFKKDRSRDINLQMAIADTDRGSIDLHVIGETGLTTTVKEIAISSQQAFETISVPVTTLNTICDKYGEYGIDFLKIDVEGAEDKVIGAFDMKRYRPRVIVLENTRGEIYQPILLRNGYIYAWFDALNRWYVREEDEFRCDLIARPPSVWDNFIVQRG
jgi:FkbM family methyltransferase